MPVTHSEKIIPRSTHAPYPSIVPPSHPPVFDVDELYDWSHSSTGVGLASQRSLPPQYSPSPNVLLNSGSLSEITCFYHPACNYPAPAVTRGSSIVNLPLSTSPRVSRAIQSESEIIQTKGSASASHITSPRVAKPIEGGGRSPGHDLKQRRRSSKGSQPPAKQNSNYDVVDVEEFESEESGDDYEEEHDDGIDSGSEDASEPESGCESEDWEEYEVEAYSDRSARWKGGKHGKAARKKRVDTEKEVGSLTRAARPESAHPFNSTKAQHFSSTPRDHPPFKSGSSRSSQRKSSGSREDDSDSTTGRDDTAEQPWELTKVRGPIRCRKLPEGHKPGTWTFSRDGAGRQSIADRSEGDIHFSPGFSGSVAYDYWVCTNSPVGQR
ncbi:hypothetical protein FRC11_011953, partial [Ceratobasidium sp. 423]